LRVNHPLSGGERGGTTAQRCIQQQEYNPTTELKLLRGFSFL